MLSDLERDRLKTRETDAPGATKIRAINDMRVKKKLHAWLNDISDIKLIFHYLPESQLVKELKDDDAFAFIEFAWKTMDCLGFDPVKGEIDIPGEWKVVYDGEANQRLAEDADIIRSLKVAILAERLGQFVSAPISLACFLSNLDKNPKLRDRVTDGERKGINRLDQAIEDYRKKSTAPPLKG